MTMPDPGDCPKPLFPLGTVLCPGGFLPLQIFEPRYLHLMRDCERNQRPFVVVPLLEGREVNTPAGGERLAPVGTLAWLERVEVVQPGLLRVVCRGGDRVRLHRAERGPLGLWRADTEVLSPEPQVSVPTHLLAAADHLVEVCAQIHAQVAATGDSAAAAHWAEPTQAERQDCSWVAWRWLELLPVPLADKAKVLQLDNPLLRLELVEDWLHGLQGPGR